MPDIDDDDAETLETGTEPTDSEKPEKRKIIRLMARGMFKQAWKDEKPNASAEERKAAFEKARPEQRKSAKRLYRFLEKNGIEMMLTKDTSKDPSDDSDDS